MTIAPTIVRRAATIDENTSVLDATKRMTAAFIRSVVVSKSSGINGHDVWLPALQDLEIIFVTFHLQVDQIDLMPCLASGLGHQLKPQQLQSQIDFGIHQGTRMHSQNPHTQVPP